MLLHSVMGFTFALKGGTAIMYRQGRNYENLNKGIFDGTGTFDIPCLFPENVLAKQFIGFNYAKTCKQPYDKGLHFFVDDYQFTRCWTNPDAYLDMLRKFKVVCTPDFSTYTDFPKAVQIFLRLYRFIITTENIGSVLIGRITA